ncbi:MAG: hypothetical protein M1152_00655 [Actinobacteria bacterium]|nr:hypothetical protein [Actinomycetota bacterium]
MRRKTLDKLLTAGGGIFLLVMLLVGALSMWGYSFANSTVHNQLAAQDIFFPPKAAFAHAKVGTEITPSMIPSVSQYAGQQLLNGEQAKVYADNFIAVHLSEMPYGGVYAKASAAAMALPKGSPAYAKAEGLVSTIFEGTTLRGMLLNAWGWWLIGQIALWVSILAFVFAGLLIILVAIGSIHAKVTSETEVVKTLARAA